MSKSRTQLSLEEAANLFKVLGHPHRLAILLRLCETCGTAKARDEDAFAACVGDLAEGLNIAPSTVSHHIKELRQAGIIHVRRNGQQLECCANFAVLQQVYGFLGRRCCE